MPYENVGQAAVPEHMPTVKRGWYLSFRGAATARSEDQTYFIPLACQDSNYFIRNAEREAVLAWEEVKKRFVRGRNPAVVYIMKPPLEIQPFE